VSVIGTTVRLDFVVGIFIGDWVDSTPRLRGREI
jgi:hypothetical protein